MFNKMKYKFGIMQGRLLPKYKGRYQAHPVGYWKDEFIIASKLGLDSIEFILDYNESINNPLLTPEGIQEIQKIENSSGVKVRSICADYFMESPLHSENPSISIEGKKVLTSLIKNASKLGVKDIVIPCVDQSSMKNQDALDRFIYNLKPMVEIAEDKKINLSLETDLPPNIFLNLSFSVNKNSSLKSFFLNSSNSLLKILFSS